MSFHAFTILFIHFFCIVTLATKQSNLLFVSIDNLRLDLSIYGKSHMITPNFERLAERAVVFNNAYAQTAIFNPSRISLLTDLRPEITNVVEKVHEKMPYLIFPTLLARLGYKTIGIGNIVQQTESDGNEVWRYQYPVASQHNVNVSHMNSTVIADGMKPEHEYPNYVYASKAIEALRRFKASDDYFMVAVGLNMPHTSLHMPSKYLEMYRNISATAWRLSNEERRYPKSAPIFGYQCCAQQTFKYMQFEGAPSLRQSESLRAQDLNYVTPQDMHTQLMWGYAAAISFIDTQLGRILDSLDELDLLKNTTIVLTSTRGTHNGEKGMWDKWSLFDESTRIPLIIHHPLSSMKGKRYTDPVEVIDIFPTILDLLGAPVSRKRVRFEQQFFLIQGQSLASFVLDGYSRPKKKAKLRTSKDFALSQKLVCAQMDALHWDARTNASLVDVRTWNTCDMSKAPTDEISVMGYSMRTVEFRYTAWLPVDRGTLVPMWSVAPFAEELYDHRGEELGELGHREIDNIVDDAHFLSIKTQYHKTLMSYLKSQLAYSQNSLVMDAKENAKENGGGAGSGAGNTGVAAAAAASVSTSDESKGSISLRAGPMSGAGGRRSKKPITRTPRNITHQTNLLFIIFDDLRPELSIYGKSHMITPNFERLARRSVVFDQAHCQIAVCNPSRDSLLTGLRPDTVGTWNFFSSYARDSYLIFPTMLKRSGYRTFGYGKIRHWEYPDPGGDVWEDNTDLDWYNYQNYESKQMNSTVMPDKITPQHQFRDHNFTTQAINTLRKMHGENKDYYMVALGFKMPHTSLHIPWKYFDMYRSRSKFAWQLPRDKRSYPPTAPIHAWRCCSDVKFRYMNEEGALPHEWEINFGAKFYMVPQDMYTELMWGYSAAISFVDYQLGRVLDVLDELDLWKNLTIVLTADHGHHNGEKGMWEKWTSYDESTKVPLIIYHPSSRIKGQHYAQPVELLDLFPTIVDLLGAPYDEDRIYRPTQGSGQKKRKIPLQGRSLARIVLGRKDTTPREFAITQTLKCAHNRYANFDPRTVSVLTDADKDYLWYDRIWFDCDTENKTTTLEVPMMGYSMRTLEYRYTLWLLVDRAKLMPVWTVPFLAEELYDHRGESLSDLGRLETENVAGVASYKTALTRMRDQLVAYLRNEVVYVRNTTTLS